MRRTVGVAFKRDSRHANARRLRKCLLQGSVLRFALYQAQAPAVVEDGDGHVIGVVQAFGAAFEGGLVKGPLRRGGLPDQLGEIVGVFLVAGGAAFGGEVELVPPCLLYTSPSPRD